MGALASAMAPTRPVTEVAEGDIDKTKVTWKRNPELAVVLDQPLYKPYTLSFNPLYRYKLSPIYPGLAPVFPFFEGPEKTLRLKFVRKLLSVNSLRDIAREMWQKVLNMGKISILKEAVETSGLTAYLLSESSMFIWDDEIMVKTCSTMPMFKIVPALLDLVLDPPIRAKNDASEFLEYCTFKRLAYMRSHEQQGPHTSWDAEVEFLNMYCQGQGKSVSCILGTEGDSMLHVYAAVFKKPTVAYAAYCLEVNMWHMDTSVSMNKFGICNGVVSKESTPMRDAFDKLFNPKSHVPASQWSSSRFDLATCRGNSSDSIELPPGRELVVENAKVDDYMFEPFGHSSNAIIEKVLATIHVAPQPGFSYLSCETNLNPATKEVRDYFVCGSGGLCPSETLVVTEFSLGSQLPVGDAAPKVPNFDLVKTYKSEASTFVCVHHYYKSSQPCEPGSSSSSGYSGGAAASPAVCIDAE